MKLLNRLSILCVGIAIVLLGSCKSDESLSPIPQFQTGVHGYAKYASGSDQDFIFAGNNGLNLNFQWVSIDQKNTVTKIQFFVLFSDSYIYKDGTRRIARIGGKNGRLVKTIEGGAVPANRTNLSFSLTQEELYQAYKEVSFDYGDTTGLEPVFSSITDNNAARVEGARFVSGDAFTIRWELTTADGRVFNQWSDGICAEYETYHGESPNDGGFNCTVPFAVKCVSAIGGAINYEQTGMLKAGAAFPGTITGTVNWTQNLDTEGNPIPGSYDTDDASFGHFTFVYEDSPAKGPQISDACNTLTLIGGDQYTDTYSYSVVSIAGPVMVINWVNSYNDGGNVTLTRADGTDWPPLIGG